jgi:glucose 1-dehydrogenase
MKSAGSLLGRVALVTGSARGIGRAIALAYAEAGACVAVNDRVHEDAARELVEIINTAGGRATPALADVADIEGHDAVLDAIEKTLGPINILVNNAAVESRAAFLDFTSDEWDRQMSVNLKAVYFLSQNVARRMAGRGQQGRIINLSSTHATRPMPRNSIYNIAKGGMAMLTQSLALELAPSGITVNNLVPGAIRTEMNRAVLADPAYEARVLAKIPLGWIAEPSDLAAAAVFLASDASRYMTGADLTLDGGLSL